MLNGRGTYAYRIIEFFINKTLLTKLAHQYEGLEFGTDYAASKHGVRAIWKTTRYPRPSMVQYQSNLLAPTYVSKKKIAGKSEANLRERKFKRFHS